MEMLVEEARQARVVDVQSRPDARGIPIDQVGVSDLSYPIVVLDRQKERQHTIARVTMSVSLPHHFKGTHMSRFIEILNEHRGEVTMRTLPTILRGLKTRLDAETARVELHFPYFIALEPLVGSWPARWSARGRRCGPHGRNARRARWRLFWRTC